MIERSDSDELAPLPKVEQMSREEIDAALYPRKRSNHNQTRDRSRRTMDGIVFGSEIEKDRYVVLKALQRNGDISQLQCHPTFTFIVQGVPVGKYTPDFGYHDCKDRVRIEDVKGFTISRKTGRQLPRYNREFPWQRNLMRACFGLEVEVVF